MQISNEDWLKQEIIEKFKQFLTENIKLMKVYYLTIIQIATSQNIPTFFIRYEDIRLKPQATMTGVAKFMLGTDKIEGTEI